MSASPAWSPIVLDWQDVLVIVALLWLLCALVVAALEN